MGRRILICLLLLLAAAGCSRPSTSEKENTNTAGQLIQSISVNNGQGKAEILLKDNSVNLKVYDNETVISDKAVSDNLDELKKRYSLFEAEKGIIAVVYRDHTVSREFMIFELIKYNESEMLKLFSSRDISAKIQSFDDNEGIMEISIPKYNAVYAIKLTNEELGRWKEKKGELDDESLVTDSEFLKNIEDNLLLNPVDYYIADMKQSGGKKLYILSEVYTAGAITPSIRDRAVIEFDLTAEDIKYSGIVLERDSSGNSVLFSYFGKQ